MRSEWKARRAKVNAIMDSFAIMCSGVGPPPGSRVNAPPAVALAPCTLDHENEYEKQNFAELT